MAIRLRPPSRHLRLAGRPLPATGQEAGRPGSACEKKNRAAQQQQRLRGAGDVNPFCAARTCG